jgi:transposase
MYLEMYCSKRHRILWKIALGGLICLLFIRPGIPGASAEQAKAEKDTQRVLNMEAANALWRLQQALKNEGFYSGRVRLNVWRAAAIDAGTFDPAKYEEFKKQLYEKSVNESLKCFEYFVEQNSYPDANMCLQTWKMHAKEIDRFDESTYQELVKQLDSLKEKKPE